MRKNNELRRCPFCELKKAQAPYYHMKLAKITQYLGRSNVCEILTDFDDDEGILYDDLT